MKFKLKPGIKLNYEHGSTLRLSKNTITDELAQKFLKKHPHYIKYFAQVPFWYHIPGKYLPSNFFKLGVIIPTLRERPELLKFVLKRISEQTRIADEILIVDYPNVTDKADIAKRYKEGLQQLFDRGCELVAMIEDDDYYPITYLEELSTHYIRKGRPDLIGSKYTVYYHIISGQHLKVDPKHCSAFCTAVGRNAKIDVCDDYEAYYDVKIWQQNKGVQVVFDKMPIGIKHGIGRCGGGGHKGSQWYQKIDRSGEYLKSITDPEAYEIYNKYRTASVQAKPNIASCPEGVE